MSDFRPVASEVGLFLERGGRKNSAPSADKFCYCPLEILQGADYRVSLEVYYSWQWHLTKYPSHYPRH